ncbi:MAG: methyl-coenzyme M reductase operon protein D [Methanobacterium sp.]|uniref:methyl-coenzyme M reductase operon protein D n=1 Tax=Methanobacterium sp. TaxID=2164 RepID=UPI003D649A56|nr:methyl-coenzyme M reductase operon protein D [Methanobacterium sp.]
MEEIKAVDVKIFPYRRLKPETTEKILNGIMEYDGILRVIVNGNSIPKIVGYGPAKGTQVNHKDRKVIKVKKDSVELRVSVGELIITVNYENLELFLEKLQNLLENTLNFEYEVSTGIFTKTNITVSDYLKLGYGFENSIDPRIIGMVDPNSMSRDTIKLIGD